MSDTHEPAGRSPVGPPGSTTAKADPAGPEAGCPGAVPPGPADPGTVQSGLVHSGSARTDAAKPAATASRDGGDARSGAPRRAPRRPAPAAISPAVARQIDENLKRLYRRQVEQDLPADLQALVDRLRAGEGRPPQVRASANGAAGPDAPGPEAEEPQ